MVKLSKLATWFLSVVVMLSLMGTTSIAYAAEASGASNEVVHIDFSEDVQKLKLEKGKSYVISCPVSGYGWQISELRYCDGDGTWRAFDDTTKNKLIVETLPQSEPDKVQFLVKCKSTSIIGLEFILENELTGEKKGYTFSLTVTVPTQEYNIPFDFIPTPPSDDEEEVTPPSGDEEVTPPSPIVIDTSGWSFDSITTVYDGKEHTIEVVGLPDYVTPVYTTNTRTNAGTTTAHVSFLVPEGYAVPDDMAATITIEKAPIYAITQENLVADGGKLKFVIPDDALPEGVTYAYMVNGEVQDGDYSISSVGSYLISAGFEFSDDFSEEMLGNYITDPSTAIFNVVEHENVLPSQYGLDFIMILKQEESQSDNEVRVSASIKFDSSGRSSVLTYVPVYDSSVLTYVTSEAPEGLYGGKINPQGVVSVSNSSYSGLLENGLITTFIFQVNDGADATNIPFSIKDIESMWISPDFDFDKFDSPPTSIILNPDVNAVQYTVMLPYLPGRSQIASSSEEAKADGEIEGALFSTVQNEDAMPDEDTEISGEENIINEDNSGKEDVAASKDSNENGSAGKVVGATAQGDAVTSESPATDEVAIVSGSEPALENSEG